MPVDCEDTFYGEHSRGIYGEDYWIIDDTRKIAICTVPKAGRHILDRSYLAVTEHRPSYYLDSKMQDEEVDIEIERLVKRLKDFDSYNKQQVKDENYLPFFIISEKYKRAILSRHPFERLYSLWSDMFKLSHHETHVRFSSKNKLMTALLTEIKKYELPKTAPPAGYSCNFEAFLHYVANQNFNEIDNLFLPTSTICQPCSNDVDYVAFGSSLNEDLVGLFEKLLDREVGENMDDNLDYDPWAETDGADGIEFEDDLDDDDDFSFALDPEDFETGEKNFNKPDANKSKFKTKARRLHSNQDDWLDESDDLGDADYEVSQELESEAEAGENQGEELSEENKYKGDGKHHHHAHKTSEEDSEDDEEDEDEAAEDKAEDQGDVEADDSDEDSEDGESDEQDESEDDESADETEDGEDELPECEDEPEPETTDEESSDEEKDKNSEDDSENDSEDASDEDSEDDSKKEPKCRPKKTAEELWNEERDANHEKLDANDFEGGIHSRKRRSFSYNRVNEQYIGYIEDHEAIQEINRNLETYSRLQVYNKDTQVKEIYQKLFHKNETLGTILYQKYKWDFMLFGFTTTGYFLTGEVQEETMAERREEESIKNMMEELMAKKKISRVHHSHDYSDANLQLH